MLTSITSQPLWVSIILVGAVVFFIYTLLGVLGIKVLNRLLIFIPILLALAVIYMQEQPVMATLLMSVGFLLSFVLAFTMLAGPQK